MLLSGNKPMHTVSFDWFLSGLEWILNLEFCLLNKTFDILEIKMDPESTICTFESIDLDLHAYRNYDHKDFGFGTLV